MSEDSNEEIQNENGNIRMENSEGPATDKQMRFIRFLLGKSVTKAQASKVIDILNGKSAKEPAPSNFLRGGDNG